MSSIPRWTKKSPGEFKPRSQVSVLYTGYVKEPEGFFHKRVEHRAGISVSASLSLGCSIGLKLEETAVN